MGQVSIILRIESIATHKSSLYLSTQEGKESPCSQAPMNESRSMAAKQKLSAAQKMVKAPISPDLGAKPMQGAAKAWCCVQSSLKCTCRKGNGIIDHAS